MELIPTGLSITSQPWIGSPRCLRPTSVARVIGAASACREVRRHARIVQQLIDAAGMIEAAVGLEADSRDIAQFQLVSELRTEEAGRPIQRLHELVGGP